VRNWHAAALWLRSGTRAHGFPERLSDDLHGPPQPRLAFSYGAAHMATPSGSAFPAAVQQLHLLRSLVMK